MVCFVAVLFSGVGVGIASDCAIDPNKCTPKGLCEVAIEVTDGNKFWSTSATSSKHVSFAQELGMNCGVVEVKDSCDTDPNECRINQLCERPTLHKDDTKSWNSEVEEYLEDIKKAREEAGADVASTSVIAPIKEYWLGG